VTFAKSVILFRAPMLISNLVTLGVWWHALSTLPGFVESVAYLFGLLFASHTLDAYERDAE
jgi:hypothetical protein